MQTDGHKQLADGVYTAVEYGSLLTLEQHHQRPHRHGYQQQQRQCCRCVSDDIADADALCL